MIYVDLRGRLGNQMFIYAFAYAISRENNNEPICFCGCKDGNSLINYPIENVIDGVTEFPMNILQRFLLRNYTQYQIKTSRMKTYEYEQKMRLIHQRCGLFLCENGFIKFERKNCRKKKIYIDGYFQSEKYFEKYRDDVKKMFEPKQKVCTENQRIYYRIYSDKTAVCVDFRLGDYINNPLHGVCTLEYYKRAMEYLNVQLNKPTFYVFSTDVEYIKSVTSDWDYNMVLENGDSPDYEKLRLMSACKHFIITNSTYDWWAQYLSKNPNKIVIAPSKWFAKECPCDIYLDNWKLFDC